MIFATQLERFSEASRAKSREVPLIVMWDFWPSENIQSSGQSLRLFRSQELSYHTDAEFDGVCNLGILQRLLKGRQDN
jgi:hypothetical protein